MTNAILQFDLNDPEDAEKFEIHCKAEKRQVALDKFSEFLRRNWKHEEITEFQDEMLEEIRRKFAELFFGD